MPQQQYYEPKSSKYQVNIPPESFWVPQEEAVDWFSQNAYMDRRGSTKLTLFGAMNSDLKNNNYYEYSQGSPYSRLPLIPNMKRSSILALPETRRSCCGNRVYHRRRLNLPDKGGLFRTRSEPEIKPVGSEPGSPRVSCMGKVRAKKYRGKETGLWARVRAILMNRFGANQVVNNSKEISKTSEMKIEPVGSDWS